MTENDLRRKITAQVRFLAEGYELTAELDQARCLMSKTLEPGDIEKLEKLEKVFQENLEQAARDAGVHLEELKELEKQLLELTKSPAEVVLQWEELYDKYRQAEAKAWIALQARGEDGPGADCYHKLVRARNEGLGNPQEVQKIKDQQMKASTGEWVVVTVAATKRISHQVWKIKPGLYLMPKASTSDYHKAQKLELGALAPQVLETMMVLLENRSVEEAWEAARALEA